MSKDFLVFLLFIGCPLLLIIGGIYIIFSQKHLLILLIGYPIVVAGGIWFILVQNTPDNKLKYTGFLFLMLYALTVNLDHVIGQSLILLIFQFIILIVGLLFILFWSSSKISKIEKGNKKGKDRRGPILIAL